MYDIPPVGVPIVPYRPLVVILTKLQIWKPQIYCNNFRNSFKKLKLIEWDIPPLPNDP